MSTIRMTGLTSGLDTDSIVAALMSAQTMKKTKIENKKTKLEWKQEIWASLNTKLYNFYTDSLNKIKTQGTYKTKAATSSDSSKVTATATSSAAEGTYRVKVNSLASAQYVTSGILSGAKDSDGNIVSATSSTKLTDLVDADGNQAFTAGSQITVSSASGTRTLLITEDTTISNFVSTLSNAGLTASFDESQQRFFISSSTSGEDQSFSITLNSLTDEQQQAVSDLKASIGYSYLSTTNQAAVDKILDQLQSGEVTYDDVAEDLESYAATAAKTGVNAYYKQKYTSELQSEYFSDEDCTTVSDAGKAALIASMVSDSVTEEEATEKVEAMTDTQLASKVSSLVTTQVTAKIKENSDEISDAVTNGVSDSDADAFLQKSADDRVEAMSELAQNYNSVMSNLTAVDGGLSGLGLNTVDGKAVAEGDDDSGMVVIAASDASITFNGATLTSSTSSLTVNGLTLNIIGETEGSEITISVTKDTSAIYDTIKDFLTEYNSILEEMNDYYDASSARDYEVLTDDEKEAMSDDEIEKWENKIKSSLLRRDDTLNSLISSFRNTMSSSYTASDGKTYSLSSLGISTSTDYAEGGLLHIWGDEDDDVYADDDNVLESLLNSDPELVMEVLTGITGDLYETLQKKMQTSTLSSALTFYNDKEMDDLLEDYEDQISDWTTKLNDLEDRYYSQFTAMETALASLQSQQSALSILLGS